MFSTFLVCVPCVSGLEIVLSGSHLKLKIPHLSKVRVLQRLIHCYTARWIKLQVKVRFHEHQEQHNEHP
jgi:hypothetical protein